MRLLIKNTDDDGRLSLVPGFLETPWDLDIVDVDDPAAFERALKRADAMVSMNWRWPVPAATTLKLLQLPGAGVDEIDFSRLPQALSILAYGESPRRDSPWFADQAEMFAKGQLKPVAFTAKDVDSQAVVRYRPGE